MRKMTDHELAEQGWLWALRSYSNNRELKAVTVCYSDALSWRNSNIGVVINLGKLIEAQNEK